jgi:hypothetical protein
MDIDFQQKFININFDKIIKQEFLDYIEYIEHKNQYFVETNINYNTYKIYQTELSDINKTQSFNTKDKFIYTYIDENRKSFLKTEMKKIIMLQNKLLENFQHYITILNTNVTYIQPKQKSFLSKFFN